MTDAAPLLVLGASGRLGRMLRAVWAVDVPAGLVPVWHSRQGDGLVWDMLERPWPGGIAAGGVVLNLGGVTDGRAPMAQNVALAMAACHAAMQARARHVFLLSSAAVYGVAGPDTMAEDAVLAPVSDYGRAKQQMEAAALAWAAEHAPRLTILRLGNVAGADALLGRAGARVTLDPVPGQAGPLRSYIGPRNLADVLARLAALAVADAALPQVMNIAAASVAMGDLLDAAGLPWSYGPDNPAVIPCVTLATDRLQSLCPLPARAGDPATMVAEWRSLRVPA